MQKNETRPPPHTIQRNNVKMGKRLNTGHDTIKVLAGNTGSKVSNIPCSNIVATVSRRAREVKEKINKRDYIKLKSVFTAKETIIKMKREPTIWENTCAKARALMAKNFPELVKDTKAQFQAFHKCQAEPRKRNVQSASAKHQRQREKKSPTGSRRLGPVETEVERAHPPGEASTGLARFCPGF